MKQPACPQLSSHKCVTTGLPKAIASNIFLVLTNSSVTKCVASEIEDATEAPSRAKICDENNNKAHYEVGWGTNVSRLKKVIKVFIFV